MSRKWRKTEGGHKRGHSNTAHWDTCGSIKLGTKTERRRQDKEAAHQDQRDSYATTPASDETPEEAQE